MFPLVPPITDEATANFCIGSHNPAADPKPPEFDYMLDAHEDDGFIERGLYHAERTMVYIKV